MNKSSESVEDEANILVAIRLRPLLEKEKKSGEMSIVRTEDNLIVMESNSRSYSIQKTRK